LAPKDLTKGAGQQFATTLTFWMWNYNLQEFWFISKYGTIL